jgi:hypothetical protein
MAGRRDGRLSGRDVAAVSVEDENTSKSMTGQGGDEILDHPHERGRPETHSSRKRHMVLGHPIRLNRCGHGIGSFRDLDPDGLRDQMVRSEHAERTVLFHASDGQDDAIIPFEISLDILPFERPEYHGG